MLAHTPPAEPRSSALDPRTFPAVSIFGVPILDVTRRDAVRLMESWISARDGKPRAVSIVNAHTLNLAADDPSYRDVLCRSDAVFGDGSGVRLAARLKGIRLRENLCGTDLLPLFFTTTLPHGHRYFLLGGLPGTASRAAATLERRFPGIRMAGHHHGHFSAAETPAVLDVINGARPDMLLVAMGNPVQECWIHEHLPRLRVPVCVGVGGLFDHWAGTLRRAPLWMRRFGIEWVQIMLQQPHKWRRYVVGNPKFVLRAVRDV
jgi:N-acetylglucosaminyldiphosphoundecaprenol N-acetyl-beta-D-mannosaminyltransferase